jgi:prophage maintenance system killer protein
MATVAMLDLAAGEMSEAEFARWLRDHTAARG